MAHLGRSGTVTPKLDALRQHGKCNMKTANLRQLHRSLLELTDLTKISKDLKRRGPSYSLFHIHLADTRSHANTLKDVLVSQTDEDRAYFAESLSDTILRITDLKDAIWFRKGVLRKETLGLTNSARHRDHSVHTLHNYLLGWYFFVHGKTIRDEFTSAFKGRGFSYTNAYGFSLAFGELWCFASLLHDVGYLFEGQVPEGSMALVDEC